MHKLPAATDVVIVGAGPTGLTLACLLAAEGVPFVLVE
jgi:2-polyprenyl-6-methoxyphenol hydroxylase-like FAD-dependent oxidoreductase